MRNLIITLCLSLAACGMPQTPMTDVATDFAAHVEELQGEFDTHATKAAAATTVSAIAELDGMHRTMCTDMLTKMDSMTAHMEMCMNTKNAKPDVMAAMDAMSKLRTAAEGHAAAMSSQANLADTKTAEDHHHAEMVTQLDLLKAQSATLKTGAMDFMCPEMATGH